MGLAQTSALILALVTATPAPPHKTAALNGHVGINVYNYSDGSFTANEPWAGVDLRAYKPFNDFNYQLSGRAGNQSFSGDARSRFMQDPSYGYVISASGFYAVLDKFGSGWTLDGDSNGRRFHYIINRNFQDEYQIFDTGLNVSLRTGGMSASVEGWYDKAQVGPLHLAVLGTVAGILSQPKLRQDPTRP